MFTESTINVSLNVRLKDQTFKIKKNELWVRNYTHVDTYMYNGKIIFQIILNIKKYYIIYILKHIFKNLFFKRDF